MPRRVIAILTGMSAAAVIALAIIHLLPSNPIPVGQPTPAPTGEDWINLLDNARVNGWKNTIDAKEIFEIKDGILHIFGRTLHPLRYTGYTAERFKNFDLHLEFKLTRHANSGVFLRAQPGDPVYRGFEVQVLEDFGSPPTKNSCGSIYDVVSPMFNMSRPRGEWNSYDISLNGTHIVVIMNGWKVIDTDFSPMTTPLGKFTVPFAQLPQEGIIALQDHGGEVWYRNILVHPR